MSTIDNLSGLTAQDKERLTRANIYTTEQLIDRCSSRHGRQTVASSTGIPEDQLHDWANKVELHRVRGLGATFDNLFDASGVHSVRDLSKANAHELYQEMRMINDKQHMVKQIPSEGQLKQLIAEARKLNPKIND